MSGFDDLRDLYQEVILDHGRHPRHAKRLEHFDATAKGDKARHFRRHLDEFAAGVALKPTQGPGDARRLATEAVTDGFDTVVAAGGDGTLNEVLNGIADAPDGFARARLAVLPLGTVNVFARELGLPLSLRRAWQAISAGRERRIDAPYAEHACGAGPRRRYFAQMAGAGLDAQAISLVDWEMKKRISQFAYVLAGMKAMRGPHPAITVEADGRRVSGELVLVGNGRFYGGSLPVFPGARLDDGAMWPVAFALTDVTPAEEKRIAALVKKAAG